MATKRTAQKKKTSRSRPKAAPSKSKSTAKRKSLAKKTSPAKKTSTKRATSVKTPRTGTRKSPPRGRTEPETVEGVIEPSGSNDRETQGPAEDKGLLGPRGGGVEGDDDMGRPIGGVRRDSVEGDFASGTSDEEGLEVVTDGPEAHRGP